MNKCDYMLDFLLDELAFQIIEWRKNDFINDIPLTMTEISLIMYLEGTI